MSTDRFTVLKNAANSEADILIEIDLYDNGDAPIRIAHKTREVIDGSSVRVFDGLLNDVSGMDERLPIDCRFTHQGEMRLRIVNQRHRLQIPADPMPRFSDMLGGWMRGAKVTAYQFYKGCEWSDVEDEIRFTGTLRLEEVEYDEKYIEVVATAQKDYAPLPPYRLSHADYSGLQADAGEIVMPIILGTLTYDGKNSWHSVDTMADRYGGAVRLGRDAEFEASTVNFNLGPGRMAAHGGGASRIPWQFRRVPEYVDDDSGDKTFMTAGLPCYDITDVYADLLEQAAVRWDFLNTTADGPSHPERLLACLKIYSAWWDDTKEWSFNVQGLRTPGAYPWTQITDPIQAVYQVLTQAYGMTVGAHFGNEIDDNSYTLTLEDWLASEDILVAGIKAKQGGLEAWFSEMMMNFPFYIYRLRNGKIAFKKWERRPAVTYTEQAISFQNEIEKDSFKVRYRQQRGPGVDVLYWPHLGIDISEDTAIPLDRGYFGHSYIKLNVYDTKCELSAAIDDDDDTSIGLVGSGGTQPYQGDLIMIGREICWVSSPTSGAPPQAINLYSRGANGTQAVSHRQYERVFILKPDSAVGDHRHDQMGKEPDVAGQTDIYIKVWEDATHNATANLSVVHGFGIGDYDDKTLAMTDLTTVLNNAGLGLNGTYECEWDPLTNFVTIRTTNAVSFKIQLTSNDWLVQVCGWWADTGMAEEHTGTYPAYFREAQLCYDYAVHRSSDMKTYQADFIVGQHLNRTAIGDYQGTICDIEPMVCRDRLFDIHHRPMRQVVFAAPMRFVNLKIGDVFPFASDIEAYLKIENQEFTDLNWQVIEARQLSLNLLEFVAEEAT